MEPENIDVKAIRARLQLTQRGLAECLGVGLNTIRKWEAGGTIPGTKRRKLQSLCDPARPSRIKAKNMDAIDVRQLRHALGLSQTALADELGVSTATIQNYEKGRPIPKTMLNRLCNLGGSSFVQTGIGNHNTQNGALPSDVSELMDLVNKQQDTINRQQDTIDKLISLLDRLNN